MFFADVDVVIRPSDIATASGSPRARYWDELKRDLKPIYTAVNADAAKAALDSWPPSGGTAIRR